MRTTSILLLLVFGQVQTYYDYADGCAEAARTEKPLVTFVGCRPFEVSGAVVCKTPYLPDYEAQCIVVSKDGLWKKTFPMTATKSDVQKEVDRHTVNPFRTVAAQSVRSANC